MRGKRPKACWVEAGDWGGGGRGRGSRTRHSSSSSAYGGYKHHGIAAEAAACSSRAAVQCVC